MDGDDPNLESAGDLLARYAELIVRIGANVQPGQDVFVGALVEHSPIVRAVAEQAYVAGARRVTVDYRDSHVQRSAVRHAPFEALGAAYPHELEQVRWMQQHGAASIGLTGNPEPHLFDGLDASRIAAASSKEYREAMLEALNSGDVAWTVAAAPNPGWARQVFGEPDLERLWGAVATATRLDAPDPVGAWRDHLDTLDRRCRALDALALDAVRFRGPGTDLTVGLIPGAGWLGGSLRTSAGVLYIPNLPTEEVFTSPDWRRADGFASCTRPLVMGSGAVVDGLRLRLESGRIVEVDADEGADAVRAQLATDERAAFLGEVSIVEGSSPIRRAGVVFHDTLFDENAGCHVAWGRAYVEALPGHETMGPEGLLAAGLNVSSVHTDVVIGGPGVGVTGIGRDGRETTILADDRWVLPTAAGR